MLLCRVKTSLFSTFCYFGSKTARTATPTFDINGHGASVRFMTKSTENASFGNIAATRYLYFGLCYYFWRKTAKSATPNFEINGHGASVRFHYNDWHLIKWHLYNSLHREGIRLLCRNKISLFRTLSLFREKTARPSNSDFSNKWSSGFSVISS